MQAVHRAFFFFVACMQALLGAGSDNGSQAEEADDQQGLPEVQEEGEGDEGADAPFGDADEDDGDEGSGTGNRCMHACIGAAHLMDLGFATCGTCALFVLTLFLEVDCAATHALMQEGHTLMVWDRSVPAFVRVLFCLCMALCHGTHSGNAAAGCISP